MDTYSCCLRYLSLVSLQYLINIFNGNAGLQQTYILQKTIYFTDFDQNSIHCNTSITFFDLKLHKGG